MRSFHARLQDDLRGIIGGEVYCDDVVRALYVRDAGSYAETPCGVVFPKSVDDVAACLGYATAHRVSVHPRGAGTGRSGGCVGRGLVLDMTRFMRRLVAVEADTIRVQAGATRARVNTMLARHQHRFFGPDASLAAATTFGSLLSADGAGPHWLRDGWPHEHLVAVQAVLASGDVIEIDRRALPKRSITESDKTIARGVALARSIIHRGHATLVDAIYDLVSSDGNGSTSPPSGDMAIPRRGGYHVDSLIGRDGSIDLPLLVAGSEGTLAVITEMTLATSAIPKVRVGAVFVCPSLERAARAVGVVRSFSPTLCEMIDRRHLVLLGESFPPFQPFFGDLRNAEAALLVELDGDDRAVLADRLADLATSLKQSDLAASARFALTFSEVKLFDRLVTALPHALSRMPTVPTAPLFDDIVVPIGAIAPTITAAQNMFRRNAMTFALSGHWGQGQLRIQPMIQSPDEATSQSTSQATLKTLTALADEFYETVWASGGAIVSEQPLGRVRTPWLARQAPQQTEIFAAIKKLCDPNHTLNPGCVVGDASETPQPSETAIARDVTITLARSARRTQLQTQLKWHSDSPEIQELEQQVRRCSHCGVCRSRESGRMCPTFRVNATEAASPRACISLLRQVVDDPDSLELLATPQAREIAEVCLHCHSCRIDCPAHIDLPQLAFRIKAAAVAAHGLSSSERMLVHLDAWLKPLSWISCPVNWSLSNRTMRWTLEKLFGLPQQRQLPRLTKIPFLTRVLLAGRHAIRRAGDPERPKVALFIDTYANHFAPAIARAAVRVLEHNGIDVHIPLRQASSGLVAFACGDADTATAIARRNTRTFGNLVRQGYTVVTLEPASATCFTNEYRYIAHTFEHHDDVDLVANHTFDLMTYLWRRYESGNLRTDFVGTADASIAAAAFAADASDADTAADAAAAALRTISYHAPCRSVAALGRDAILSTHAELLLQLVPGFEVRRVEKGCCGLGHSYRLSKKHYPTSLRVAMPIAVAIRQAETDVVATECSLCRLQLEQVCRRTVTHPITLLAEAYGIGVD